MDEIRYTITVYRKLHESHGTLAFSHGDVSVRATCWWDKKTIAEGDYIGAATMMASKNREGIFFGYKEGGIAKPGTPLPTNVPGVTARGVFIHKGNGPSWSDACIVANDNSVMSIWNAITPSDDYCVRIKVVNTIDYIPEVLF